MTGSKTGSRPYHHGALRTGLIAAALELITEHGPRGFSLTEAARRAGVSPAAPYRHFADKDALLAAIIVEGNKLLAKGMRDAMVGRTFDRTCLPDLAAAYVAFALGHRAHFQVMFQAGIDKARFPEIAASAHAALGVAIDAASRPSAHDVPGTTTDHREAALACWTIAHGVAALTVDGALATAVGENEPESVARRVVAAHFGFVIQPACNISVPRSHRRVPRS